MLPAEQLMHATVRLQCVLKNGTTSTGTGFFFSFKAAAGPIPVIVTNKHVICDSVTGSFVLTKDGGDGQPLIGSTIVIELPNFENCWLKHPDPRIDLAVFPVTQLLRAAKDQGKPLFFRSLPETIIPDKKLLESLSGLDNVIMVGYPNGLWDQANNMPLFRRGITATSPRYDFNREPIFVIDCACFPGSSGSPVLIFDQGAYADARGDMFLGGRIILLGILYAGPAHPVEGEIHVVDVPMKHVPISRSRIPNNLGYVVKSQKLLEFKKIIHGE